MRALQKQTYWRPASNVQIVILLMLDSRNELSRVQLMREICSAELRKRQHGKSHMDDTMALWHLAMELL